MNRVDGSAGHPFHPETLAKAHAHETRQRGECEIDTGRSKVERAALTCTCRPDPAYLAEVWSGRARMARARLVAGYLTARGPLVVDGDDNSAPAIIRVGPLNALDREALTRAAQSGPTPAAAR